MVAGTDGWGSPTSSPRDNLLGRRRQGLSAPARYRAAGDGGYPDLMVDVDIRHGSGGGKLGSPGGDRDSGGSSSFKGLRQAMKQFAGAWYNPGGPGGAYGGGTADGLLTVRDRHVITRRGTTKTSAARTNDPGLPNRLADGPPLAEYQMVNTSEAWQIGTDHTRNEDNQGVHNRVASADGRRTFPLGTQDGNQTLVYGPPIGEWREYGVRGVTGMHGPAPDVYDPNRGRSRPLLVQAGEPGMQPADRRFVYGGVPHGLHTPTLNSQVFTMSRQANIPQMVPPRVDRPASSKIAGQSYSQGVVPEAQAGQRANPNPRDPNPGRTPGLMNRFAPRK